MKSAFHNGLFVASCLFIATCVCHSSPKTSDVLRIYLTFIGDQIDIRAEYDNSSKSFILSRNKNDLLHDFNQLYITLENRRPSEAALKPKLTQYGKLLFDPIKSYVDSSSAIVFVIPKEFITFPFDLLYFEGDYLFLQKPVAYSFSMVRQREFKLPQNLSALIISDPTADPENGCYTVKEILPSSNYYKIEEMTLMRLETMAKTDLVLISAHGNISFDMQDYIKMGNEYILPYHLSKLKPRLVYFDSCQLGVSCQFIESFQANDTEYYIAPILSNEAGNSSTKTISFFFEELKSGNSPIFALFTTRKKLYECFHEVTSFGITLWRAFPFRLYLLN